METVNDTFTIYDITPLLVAIVFIAVMVFYLIYAKGVLQRHGENEDS